MSQRNKTSTLERIYGMSFYIQIVQRRFIQYLIRADIEHQQLSTQLTILDFDD